MRLYDGLKEKNEKLALVGLGYVGMPIAVAFARNFDVIGFDMNSEKIENPIVNNAISNSLNNKKNDKK